MLLNSQTPKYYFSNPAYITINFAGYVDPTLDPNAINTHILTAQKMNLQQLMGYDFYNDMATQLVTGGTSSLSPSYYALYAQGETPIIDSVSVWALYYAYEFILNRATNKSIVQKESTNSKSVQENIMEHRRKSLKNLAEFIDMRIIQTILNNIDYFPLYWQTSQVNSLTAIGNPYGTGDIVTGAMWYSYPNNSPWFYGADSAIPKWGT